MNKLKPGQDILLIGYPGTLGSLRILEEKPEEIRRRFSGAYLSEEIRRLIELPILTLREGKLAADGVLIHTEDGEPAPLGEADVQAKRNAGELITGFLPDVLPGLTERYQVSAIRPVGRGGVLAALWDLLSEDGVDPESGKRRSPGPGCRFRYDGIPLLQITVELCELFGLNPYRLLSEHCFLAVAGSGFQLCRDLRDRGVEAAVFGQIEEGRKRVRIDSREEAFLTNEHGEELDRLLPGTGAEDI